jgi:outer membrane protein assembly factor BamB
MNERIISRIITTLFVLISLFSMVWWLSSGVHPAIEIDIPGKDNKPASLGGRSITVTIGQYAEESAGIPSSISGSWPRFRGADYDNISKEKISLADSWEDSGPEILWSLPLGEGHAAPAVMNGRVYILDYDEGLRSDILRCLSLDDGREIWRRWYTVLAKRNHGISRTIPAVTDKYVVSIGPLCHVMCVDAITGELKWGIDLEKEYGTKTPLWYTAQCPLIDDGQAIIAPCGEDLMIGIDCETGIVLWRTPNTFNINMSHSSIIMMNYLGNKIYLYSGIGGMVGISADEETKGQVLFFTDAWNNSVIAPSPVPFGDGRIFVTAGYGAGSMLLNVTHSEGVFRVNPIYAHSPKQGLASEQQTPILYQGRLFSILPKDAGPLRNQFVCYNPDNQEIVWASGKDHRFGLGPFIIADDKIFILNDDGVLTVLNASITAFEPLEQAKIIDGIDAWGPLAIAGGRMLLRDSTRLFCIDVRGEN